MANSEKTLHTISITAKLDASNIADMEVSLRNVISEHFGVEVESLNINATDTNIDE